MSYSEEGMVRTFRDGESKLLKSSNHTPAILEPGAGPVAAKLCS